MKRIFTSVLSVLMACVFLSGCNTKTIYDNEKDAFVMSIDAMDEVYNPFFATNGADMQAIALTQLSMLTTDTDGELVCGDEWATVARDYEAIEPTTSDKDSPDYFTTYRFLLKNDLKFSDGSDLTWKDVLFNFYVYLDPTYVGSTTMYSTNIKGLFQYRTQQEDEEAAAIKEQQFRQDGTARVTNLLNAAAAKQLTNRNAQNQLELKGDLKIVADCFKEELQTDWSSAAAAITDTDVAEFTEIWHLFFNYQGFITLETVNDVKKVKEWAGYKNPPFIKANMTESEIREACIDHVYNDYINTTDKDTFNENITTILKWRGAGSTALDNFIADEKSEYFKALKASGELIAENISGISVRDKVTEFNGKTYSKEHFVLEIVVNGVDPKAIYNFSIGIAPMKYYAGAYANLFNGTNHFGVDYGNYSFMTGTVRAQDIPVGAGPYKVTNKNNRDTGTDANAVKKNGFLDDNVLYYMRNSHFLLGAPKIKFVRFKVITRAQLMDSLVTRDIHLGDPDAKNSNYNKISKNSHISYNDPLNMGYGYIGLNAKYIPDIKVRKAIMHAMNVGLAYNYYEGHAQTIYRPMSTTSWAYPTDVTEPYYAFDETGETSENLVKGSYSKKGGVLTNDYGDKLEYTFTIAGGSDDHPMYNTMRKAADILNKIGFKITVTTDPNALRELTLGNLQVWAAAWGSTIDPDMYQVYHKDSLATSVKNWGFKAILDGDNSVYTRNTTEVDDINSLAGIIDDARKTLDKDERINYYHNALDLIMELAVELPAYQRKVLYAYNNTVLDVSTMNTAVTPYSSPIAKIWELSLVTK